MADEIRESFGVESSLIAGGGGIFTVTVDREKIYDNSRNGRFPRPGEVTKLIQKR